MKILIADKLPAACVSALRSLGMTVRLEPDLGPAELLTALGDSEILVVRSTRVNEEVFAGAHHLALVVRAGAGVNTIALDAASDRGIFVANCPGKNSVAVAELTLGLLLAADRRIADNVADLHAGRWNKKRYGGARGLYGRTLGILGLGNIGVEVVHRAQAFGMSCLVWSRSLTDVDAHALGVTRAAAPIDVASGSDFVTVHVALTADTHHLVDSQFLAAMKEGSILLHTARGGVVDDAALKAAVESGKIRAGLDVYEEEPSASDTVYGGEIGRTPGVYGTHHIAASTDQAQEAVADEVVRIIDTYARTGHVPNVVNLAQVTPAHWQLTVRHLDQVGVLATVLDALKGEGINVQDVQNIIFQGAKAASASLHLDSKPSDTLLETLCESDDRILQVALVELP